MSLKNEIIFYVWLKWFPCAVKINKIYQFKQIDGCFSSFSFYSGHFFLPEDPEKHEGHLCSPEGVSLTIDLFLNSFVNLVGICFKVVCLNIVRQS